LWLNVAAFKNEKMEDPNIFLHALGYIAFIVLSGISFLVCFILFVIRISQSHPHRWNWLIGAILTLVMLLFSVFLFVSKVVNTVKNIGHHVEKQFEEQMGDLQKMDSSYNYDKLNTNEMVKKLKEFEAINHKTNVPKEFYVYYGFADYYRMPLTYPYSLHCTDVLETASLYNEENVSEFNINDNGEKEIGLPGIIEFAFDNSAIIAKTRSKENPFTVFSLTDPEVKMSQCSSIEQALKTARKEYGYRGYDTLISVLQYDQLFK
jgi:hypothetical protein